MLEPHVIFCATDTDAYTVVQQGLVVCYNSLYNKFRTALVNHFTLALMIVCAGCRGGRATRARARPTPVLAINRLCCVVALSWICTKSEVGLRTCSAY